MGKTFFVQRIVYLAGNERKYFVPQECKWEEKILQKKSDAVFIYDVGMENGVPTVEIKHQSLYKLIKNFGLNATLSPTWYAPLLGGFLYAQIGA